MFGKLESRLDAEWPSTTKEIQSTVLEFDSAHRERIHKLEDRQSALEGPVEAHRRKLDSHKNKVTKIEAEMLLSNQDPPPRVAVDDTSWDRQPHQHIVRAKCNTMCTVDPAKTAAIASAFEGVAKPRRLCRVQGRPWPCKAMGGSSHVRPRRRHDRPKRRGMRSGRPLGLGSASRDSRARRLHTGGALLSAGRGSAPGSHGAVVPACVARFARQASRRRRTSSRLAARRHRRH